MKSIDNLAYPLRHDGEALVYNDGEKRIRVLDALHAELAKADSFFLSVAFITKSGWMLLSDGLNESIHGRILTTDYLCFTDPDALTFIQRKYPNVQIKMYKALGNLGFHTKGYWIRSKDKETLFVGSSNLTDTALMTNKEWNARLASPNDSILIGQTKAEFERMWDRATPLDDYIETYRRLYEDHQAVLKKAEQARTSSLPQVISPNAMQVAFSQNLRLALDKGEKRGLLISATGTGKTFACCFGLKDIGAKRILFLAHQNQLLTQAQEAFRTVFGTSIDAKTYFLTGDRKDDPAKILKEESCLVFASRNTMSNDGLLGVFPSGFFDVLVVDEVQNAGAKTYQKILDHFGRGPRFVLGMSATPERTDDPDLIYAMFDRNVLYEIRLPTALDMQLLCPFHYYGITDLTGIDDKTYELKDFKRLFSDQRIDFIVKKIQSYLVDGDRLRGLIFCSTQEECFELSKKLNAKGFFTRAVTALDSLEDREEAVRLLRKTQAESRPKEYLDFVITVNLFNEGIDIPDVNEIVMLRPTQSSIVFTQQLGRGLRRFAGKNYVNVLDFIGNYDSNYLIPKAFCGIKSKGELRRFLSSLYLPGLSYIGFDAIAKEKVLASLAKSRLKLEDLKERFFELAHRLNRIPSMTEWGQDGMDNPDLFVRYKSYYSFLALPGVRKSIPKEWNLPGFSPDKAMYLDQIGSDLGLGTRIEEPLLLKMLIEGKGYADFEATMASEFHKAISIREKECLKAELTETWLVKAKALPFVNEDFQLDPAFKETVLSDKTFREQWVMDALDYQIQRAKTKYADPAMGTPFVLDETYSYFDYFRLMNYPARTNAGTVGGYAYEKRLNVFPVFINYDKAPDLDPSRAYVDRFLSPSLLAWEGKAGHGPDGKALQPLREYDAVKPLIPLFVRKDLKDQDDRFYFLGTMVPQRMENGEYLTRIQKRLMAKNGMKSIAFSRARFQLATPVRADIYAMLIDDFKEAK